MFGNEIILIVDLVIYCIFCIVSIAVGLKSNYKRYLIPLYILLCILLSYLVRLSLYKVFILNHIYLSPIVIMLFLITSISLMIIISKYAVNTKSKNILTFIHPIFLVFFIVPYGRFFNFISFDDQFLFLLLLLGTIYTHTMPYYASEIWKRNYAVLFIIFSGLLITLLLIELMPPVNPYTAFAPVLIFLLFVIICGIIYKVKGYNSIIAID